MMFAETKSNYVRVNSKDPGFTFTDGPCLVNRAGIEIKQDCPDRIALMLADAICKGWIEPVAYLKYNEYCWDKLSQAGEQ